MNVVLLSPHFPPNYYQFAVGVRRAEANALGIGDMPYDQLPPLLRAALTEYYWVDNLHDYDRVMRACAYFVHKYGRIEALESHNEYWLETDARLRLDFNIPGLRPAQLAALKRKSQMKVRFREAGIAVAPGQVVRNESEARVFVAEAGYPLIAKPDVGVGAAGTYKLRSDADLERFLAERPPSVDYLLESFVVGALHSFDGLTDQQGRIVFATAHFYEPGIMEVVNANMDVYACSYREIPAGLEEAGRRAVRAFDVRARFFHIEFFHTPDGRWVALEMNVRPPGGLMMDVFNFANDVDMYAQWANVVLFNAFTVQAERPYHAAFIGRKQHRPYRHTHAEVLETCGRLLVQHQPVEPIFARAMGEYAYILRSPDFDEIREAIAYVMAVNP